MHIATDLTPIERVRLIVEIVAIVLTGLWAFYTFIYTERIKPALETANAEFVPSIERNRSHGNIDSATLAVSVRNTGHTDIDIAAEAIDIVGARLGSTPQHVRKDEPTQVVDDRTLPIIQSKLLVAYSRLRAGAKGGQNYSHLVLHPGEHFDYRFLVTFPRNRFDVVKLSFAFVYNRFPIENPMDVTLERKTGGLVGLKPGHGVYSTTEDTDFML